MAEAERTRVRTMIGAGVSDRLVTGVTPDELKGRLAEWGWAAV